MENHLSSRTNWIDEYHEGVRYGLEGRVLLEEKSSFQKIQIIESKRYGKGLLLDGCWMTTEKQEKHYHECLVHPALCTAESIKKVLIIGGGDGGAARECLRYKEVETIDLVEIDRRVVELSQEYLPSIGGAAWKDKRLTIRIEDGIKWVINANSNSYDVIIIDSADPAGPAEGLFNKNFYRECKRILKHGGIFSSQTESPEAFQKIHIDSVRLIRSIFNFADPLYGPVPIYPSGWWSWTFAALDAPRYRNLLANRVSDVEQKCDIWSPRWQQGAFEIMPAFVERELKK